MDLHVHVGRARGRPVKITASPRLTVESIIEEATARKGLDIVGIVDAHSPPVLEEMERLRDEGRLRVITAGGLRLAGDLRLLVIPASEVEIELPGAGPVHFLAYFPDLDVARSFSGFLGHRVTNLSLSTQRARLTAEELARWLLAENGFLVPAHVFTPHRGFFGQGGRDLDGCFGGRARDAVPAVELGLSADTAMAEGVPSLSGFTFVSNSDAHSPRSIAREFNLMVAGPRGEVSYEVLLDALRHNRLAANYGLDPRIGKYYLTACSRCGHTTGPGPDEPEACPDCGAPMARGVRRRIAALTEKEVPEVTRVTRPPYVHQIPLDRIPGVGAATYRILVERFGSERRVLHEIPVDLLTEAAGPRLAEYVCRARRETALIGVTPGGGGRYGRVVQGHIKPRRDE